MAKLTNNKLLLDDGCVLRFHREIFFDDFSVKKIRFGKICFNFFFEAYVNVWRIFLSYLNLRMMIAAVS